MKTPSQVQRRKIRTRARLKKTSSRPRLSVFRSNRYIYAQLIDDTKGKTILGVSERKLSQEDRKTTKTNRAKALGKLVAKMSLEKKIGKVVFDKGSSRYHGRVRALAEGAREGGLAF